MRIVPVSDDAESRSTVHLLDLIADLLVVVLEQTPLDVLLSARATCWRMYNTATGITRLVVCRKEQLSVPLMRPFGNAVLWLELEGVTSEWLPRLGSVMAMLPRLQRLFLRRARPAASLADVAALVLSGALQAGTCRALHHLNIDERLPEDKACSLAAGRTARARTVRASDLPRLILPSARSC